MGNGSLHKQPIVTFPHPQPLSHGGGRGEHGWSGSPSPRVRERVMLAKTFHSQKLPLASRAGEGVRG